MHNQSCVSYVLHSVLETKIIPIGALGFQLLCFVLHHTYIRSGDL